MRRLKCLVMVASLLTASVYGQEFKVHDNGLIYRDTTMSQLRYIVDSLNLKFKNCELDRKYYAKYQAKAHCIRLDTGDIESAREDLQDDISFKAFKKKYPLASIAKNLLIVKQKYVNGKGQKEVEFSQVPLKGNHGKDITYKGSHELYKKPMKGKWAIDYWEGGDYTDESLKAFYFTTSFKKQQLPDSYARLVQYADCMIDTNTKIYKQNARKTGGYIKDTNSAGVQKFLNYIHRHTDKPEYNDSNYERYRKKMEKWDSTRFTIINNKLADKNRFNSLLENAVNDALKAGGSTSEFETYVSRYYSKKKALELKRSRKVIGTCSQDKRPRIHARNIAMLAAQSASWDVFLRAHLNIMNDRFSRASDGSYAWDSRKTYIKELEKLGINIPDLIFGITLRVENPSNNHYYGNIRRIGRALAESKYAERMEKSMLKMIEDQALDDYNRMIAYYLYLNYTYRLDNQKAIKQNKIRLKESVKTLPVYIQNKVKVKVKD